jgi:hypothetical protein
LLAFLVLPQACKQTRPADILTQDVFKPINVRSIDRIVITEKAYFLDAPDGTKIYYSKFTNYPGVADANENVRLLINFDELSEVDKVYDVDDLEIGCVFLATWEKRIYDKPEGVIRITKKTAADLTAVFDVRVLRTDSREEQVFKGERVFVKTDHLDTRAFSKR